MDLVKNAAKRLKNGSRRGTLSCNHYAYGLLKLQAGNVTKRVSPRLFTPAMRVKRITFYLFIKKLIKELQPQEHAKNHTAFSGRLYCHFSQLNRVVSHPTSSNCHTFLITFQSLKQARPIRKKRFECLFSGTRACTKAAGNEGRCSSLSMP